MRVEVLDSPSLLFNTPTLIHLCCVDKKDAVPQPRHGYSSARTTSKAWISNTYSLSAKIHKEHFCVAGGRALVV